ncbi:hypothetical protein BZA70DRAFT_267560 [Myxozyma melibiosi]|uniref:PX domain-containing protein n=1 Tax=Myxozyma melibiosi TaxID=54550 RepID=A0ABR1F5A3_9ASCO
MASRIERVPVSPPIQQLQDLSLSDEPQKQSGIVTESREKTTLSSSLQDLMLTGQQEHYLKKELISLEIEHEIAGISTPNALARFGAPFRDSAAQSPLKAKRSSGRSMLASMGLARHTQITPAELAHAMQANEIRPEDSEFPILRHVFINHVRNFPFLDSTDEIEFWQNKVQTFWETFSAKRISSTDDRTEETKRRRLAFKIQKMIEIMMSSGIRTASGLERGVHTDDSDLGTTTTTGAASAAHETGDAAHVSADEREKFMTENAIDGRPINGFDINVVGVRTVYQRKRVKNSSHLEFIIRTRVDGREAFVSKRYSDFRDLHTKLLHAFPEKSIPKVPMKNKSSSTVTDDNRPHSAPMSTMSSDDEKGYDDSDNEEIETPLSPLHNHAEILDEDMSPRSSLSHVASDLSAASSSGASSASPHSNGEIESPSSPRPASVGKHSTVKKLSRKLSMHSLATKRVSESVPSLPHSPLLTSPSQSVIDSKLGHTRTGSMSSDFRRTSAEILRLRSSRELHLDAAVIGAIKLLGESQRLSLRAFLRSCVGISAVAESEIFRSFLLDHGFSESDLTPAEVDDVKRRMEADEQRLEEQFRFFQIASQRARELDAYIADFKKELIQRDGLSRFFSEIRQKERLADLSPRYQKFVEWARIEIAATIYHLFVGQDNASDLLAQTKRIHRLMPYAVLKSVIRFSNPVSMMKTVLDLFLAQPFGQKSLLQRILYIALSEDLKMQEKAIQVVRKKINNEALCNRIQKYVEGDEALRGQVDWEINEEAVDVIVAIAKTDAIDPPLDVAVIGKIINSWIAWNIAVDDVNAEVDDDIRFFSNLKSLLKLMIRKRDKDMILSLTGEKVTMDLIKDVFTMFYEPLVRVYKSASVHRSVGDVADFVDDLIKTVEECDSETTAHDANVLVQKFVDLCERHQESFYRFVHEVHVNDNGLFTKLMLWIEEILQFLREGPDSTIDMNELFIHSTSIPSVVDPDTGETIVVDREKLLAEIDAMIDWNLKRKLWREKRVRDRLRQGKGVRADVNDDSDDEEAQDEAEWRATLPSILRSEDFGLRGDDLAQFEVDQSNISSEEDEDEDEDLMDPIEYERRARARRNRRGGSNGEPPKPDLVEIPKLLGPFVERLKVVLA